MSGPEPQSAAESTAQLFGPVSNCGARSLRSRIALLCTTALAGLLWLCPASPAHATVYTHTICVKGTVDTLDRNTSGATALTWLLRGTPVAVSRNGNTLFSGYSDKSSGCVTFGDTTQGSYTVGISTRAIVGEVGTYNIRAHATRADFLSDTVQTWYGLGVPTTCVGTVCNGTVTFGTGPQGALIALAIPTWAYQVRVDSEVGYLQSSISKSNPIHWYYWPEAANSASGYFNAPRKFLVGHELGHQFAAFFGGSFDCGTSYGYRSNAQMTLLAPVQWTGDGGVKGGHALRSQEAMPAAASEGNAHFWSTWLFKTSATADSRFHYYKNCGDAGACYNYVVVNPNGGSSTGGAVAFLEASNGGNCAFFGTCDDTGTELDWLRTYWQFRFNSGTQPSMADIVLSGDYSQTCQNQGNPPGDPILPGDLPSHGATWGLIRSELNAGLRTRWDTVSATNGIDQ